MAHVYAGCKLIGRMKPLSYFLQTSMLSTDTEASNEDDKNSQLVSTWQVVNTALMAESNDHNCSFRERTGVASGIHTRR